jgi:hypothetical protein
MGAGRGSGNSVANFMKYHPIYHNRAFPEASGNSVESINKSARKIMHIHSPKLPACNRLSNVPPESFQDQAKKKKSKQTKQKPRQFVWRLTSNSPPGRPSVSSRAGAGESDASADLAPLTAKTVAPSF